jgi:uncharacterized membrane protein
MAKQSTSKSKIKHPSSHTIPALSELPTSDVGIQSGFGLAKFFPWLLLIGGAIAVLCAGILTVEKMELLQNPQTTLVCDINPVVACGNIIATPQASAFGFPNPIIGLVGFGAVAAIGAGLLAGARFKRWFWIGLELGMVFAVGFVTWLQYQSLYVIGALCPFCMVVWAVTIPLFIYTTLYNLRLGHIRVQGGLAKVTAIAQDYHITILAVWYLLIVVAILIRFWQFWSTFS